MKLTIKLLALFFGVLMLVNAANAESPREQLKQMVEQLQENPDDDALRVKIIKHARKLRPAPKVPDSAVEFEGRAQFAFKNAKTSDDYLAAASEYEEAVADAPWVSGYYSDLCTIYEKAGKFEDANRNCEFSLAGLIDAVQITDIKRRIAGLKYGIEQNSPSAVAEREKERVRKFLANFEGGIWNGEVLGGPLPPGVVTRNGEAVTAKYYRYSYEIRSSNLVHKRADWDSIDRIEPSSTEKERIELKHSRVKFSSEEVHPSCNPVTVQISEDGEAIEESYTCNGRSQNNKYLRKH